MRTHARRTSETSRHRRSVDLRPHRGQPLPPLPLGPVPYHHYDSVTEEQRQGTAGDASADGDDGGVVQYEELSYIDEDGREQHYRIPSRPIVESRFEL